MAGVIRVKSGVTQGPPPETWAWGRPPSPRKVGWLEFRGARDIRLNGEVSARLMSPPELRTFNYGRIGVNTVHTMSD